jgi:bifunctional non-homologous end joining protein LigD
LVGPLHTHAAHRGREPFDHPEWLFELKYDGFRALLSLGAQRPEFISRNANTFARFANLAPFIYRELDARAILDGEIVCFDREGRPRFYDLMFRRGEPAFVAFDVLALEGKDLRDRTLVDRKKILRRLIPRRSPFVLFADHIDARGRDFYRLVCQRDLEGIVAKWKTARRMLVSRQRCSGGIAATSDRVDRKPRSRTPTPPRFDGPSPT